jgi:FlaA1/EpsC-like NDP-sugar epimerase
LRPSVIPLFRSQIERGGPVTVTHPEVTRYFMTIPEAAQLIVQAGALGQGGEIFVLKMGQPVRIADLARDLIILSGKDPAEIEVKFTGLRPGEKLYEELITAGEGVLETGHDKTMVLRSGRSAADNVETLEILLQAARCFDEEGVRRGLQDLVPEYSPEKNRSGRIESASASGGIS